MALETECLIQQTIRELHATYTIFMIAHRLSAVKGGDNVLEQISFKVRRGSTVADVILVLDSGRALKRGAVEQLLEYDSYFLRVSGMQVDVETLP